MSAAEAQRWAGEHEARILQALFGFVSIPSVSTDPAFAAGMARGAGFLADHLRACGIENVALRATGGHPVVTGDWLHAAGRPTILVYGHYDVQPPDPLDRWQSAPFEPEIRDGRIYARGVSDDKGPLIVAVSALAAWLATDGTLPVNVKLLFEGEEEIGSAHLDGFVASHAAELAADFVLSADGAMWRLDLPTVTVASRGLCALELTVTGAAKDLHSGRHGGAVANPLQALCALLAGLHAGDGSVAVPGFYDRVRAAADSVRREIAAVPFDEADYLRGIGAPAGAGEAGWTLLERNWLRPTLELNGLSGGYAGPGTKTVIPSQAHAKVTCRLVLDQDPAEILDAIARDLHRRTGPGVTLDIVREEGGAHPAAIADTHPGLRLAMQVLEELYGRPAVPVRMGATLPVAGIFRHRLGLDTVFFSFSTTDEDYHAPNEFFRLERLRDGIRAWIRYLQLLGEAS